MTVASTSIVAQEKALTTTGVRHTLEQFVSLVPCMNCRAAVPLQLSHPLWRQRRKWQLLRARERERKREKERERERPSLQRYILRTPSKKVLRLFWGGAFGCFRNGGSGQGPPGNESSLLKPPVRHVAKERTSLLILAAAGKDTLYMKRRYPPKTLRERERDTKYKSNARTLTNTRTQTRLQTWTQTHIHRQRNTQTPAPAHMQGF